MHRGVVLVASIVINLAKSNVDVFMVASGHYEHLLARPQWRGIVTTAGGVAHEGAFLTNAVSEMAFRHTWCRPVDGLLVGIRCCLRQ